MNANEQIDEIIAKLPDWRGTTFTNIRKIIKDTDTEIVEELKRFSSSTRWITTMVRTNLKINVQGRKRLLQAACWA